MSSAVLIVAGFCLFVGLAAGFLMHRSDYCMAGMFRDLFLFRSTLMLRTLLLLIITSMILFEGARLCGLLPFFPFPLLGTPSGTNIIGGFIFGIGMVLAGGCVIGTLYKMGAGSILSLVAFFGLLAGSGLYAEIHPFWSILIKKTTILPGVLTLPQLFKLDPVWFIGPTVLISVWFFLKWQKQGLWLRQSHAEGYLQPWRAAVGLAVINLISYISAGMPMGVTTTYAKMAGYFELWFYPKHLASLSYFQALPLNARLPWLDLHLMGGAAPKFDAIAYIQGPVIIGIILGSAISALLLREFQLHWRLPWRQYVSVFSGGIIMALASRMAPACNVWHLMGGLPILALQSILFLVGLFGGAWVGGRLLTTYVMKL